MIKHRPLTSAIRNQTLSIRAEIIETSDAIETVTLYFSTSADSAPFKAPMKQLGAKVWAGSIPAAFMQGHQTMDYYIAAMNRQGVTTETPWHRVKLYTLDEATQVPARQKSSTTAKNEPKSWVKPALIAGGAVALAGGIAIAVSGSGGGGGGGDSDDASPQDSTNPVTAGTYAGTATTCFTTTDTECETHMFAITISSDGYATSDTLLENEYMRTPVNGNEITFIARDSNPDRTGEITYSATILDDRIIGSVSGAGTSDDTPGTYSGTFNAVRQ